MQIGELFINIGLEGADSAKTAFNDIRKGLNETASAALKVTATLTGALYAFREFTKQSTEAGLGLVKFNNYTGLSEDSLQRWQQLGIASGVAAERMTSDITELQEKMTQMILSGGNPATIEALANTVGFDVNKARDTNYVLAKVREYALKTKDIPDIANKVLQPFVSRDLIQAFRTSTFDLQKDFDPRRAYTSGQAQQLAQMEIGWNKMMDRIQHEIGRFQLRFGPNVLKQLTTETIPALIEFFNSLATLLQRMQALHGLQSVIKGWSQLFKLGSEAIGEENRKPTKARDLLGASPLGALAILGASAVAKLGGGGAPVQLHTEVNVTLGGPDLGANPYSASVDLANIIAKHVQERNQDMINQAFRQRIAGGGE